MIIIKNDLCPHDTGIEYRSPAIIHCVSACGIMGAGFAKNVPARHKFLFRSQKHEVGTCHFTFTETSTYAHLVTKPFGYDKPTMLTFTKALTDFLNNPAIHKISREWHSPMIGCGLDGLKQESVMAIIDHLMSQRQNEIDWYIHIPAVKVD